MQINPRTSTTKNPPAQFTGDVWLDPIASPREEGQRMIVVKVRFAPGASVRVKRHRPHTMHIRRGYSSAAE